MVMAHSLITVILEEDPFVKSSALAKEACPQLWALLAKQDPRPPRGTLVNRTSIETSALAMSNAPL